MNALFDIYCTEELTPTLRIYDDRETPRGYYEARNKIFIQRGWNH
jgi:hypothetical protein